MKNLFQSNLFFFFIVFFYVLGNLLWVHLNTLPPFYDSAGHTNLAFLYADIFTGEKELSSIKDFFTVSTYYPPLVFIIGGILTSIFGYDYKVLQFSSVLFLGISALFLYLYTKELTRNKNLAIVTAAIFVVLPQIWEQSRYFMLDMPLTTLIILTLYALEKFNNTNKNIYLLLSFLLIGLAQLIKWYGIIYLAIPLLFTLYKYIKYSKERKRAFVFIFISMISGLVLILPWYVINFPDLIYWSRLSHDADFGDPSNFLSLRNFLFYPTLLINYQVVSAQFVLLTLASLLFFRQRPKEGLLFGLEIISVYLFFTFTGNKNLRYTLPLLPFLAVIMGYGTMRLYNYNLKGKLLLAGFFLFSLVIFLINSFGLPTKTDFRLSLELNKLNKNLDNLYLLDLSNNDVPYSFMRTPTIGKDIVKDLSEQSSEQIKIFVGINSSFVSVAGLDIFNRDKKRLHFEDAVLDGTKIKGKTGELLNKYGFILIPDQIVGPAAQDNYLNLSEARRYVLAGETRDFALIKTYHLPNNDSLYLLKNDKNYNKIEVQLTENEISVTRPEAVANIYLQFMDFSYKWTQEVILAKETKFRKSLNNIVRIRLDYPSNLIFPEGNGWTYDQDKQFDINK